MFKRYLILIYLVLSLLVPKVGNAQARITFPAVEEATYRNYLEGNWDSIIYYGRLAARADISYFYLDLRMGIARFEKKQYLQASGHFRKALSRNSSDDLSSEYLYYTYLYTGQYNRADRISREFSADLAQRITPAKSKFLKMVNLESVYSKSNATTLKNDLWGETVDGGRTIMKDLYFLQSLFIHQPSPGFTIEQAISYLHKDNLYYIRSEASEVLFPDQNLNQLDYYIIPRITLKSGLTISPSFHFTTLSSEVLEKVNFGYGMNASTNVSIDSDYFLIGGLELKQRIWLFNILAGGSYIARESRENYQQQIGITCYPLGNLNLYAGFDYYLTDNDANDSYFENNIWHIKVGGSIKEKVWIEGRYTEGEMLNFREYNNAIFYNSPDFMNRKAQIHLSIPKKENKGVFYFGSRWANHVTPYFNKDEEQVDMNNIYEYLSITFYAGISWNIL